MSDLLDERSQIKYNNEILDLYDAANVCFDPLTKTIEVFSMGSRLIGVNLSINEFASKFIEEFELLDTQHEKIVKFFSNFESQEGLKLNMEISFEIQGSKSKMKMKTIGVVRNDTDANFVA